ncbi:stage II sporulation protein M [Nanoarchaeota archaeon NZ13-N]|uniref:Stage II sporulation protein M n=1 Tax=Candidatus Nanoclepta minutus TaxID=1940235 RepID=A0A397WN15_9ARCH|nr:MAG: stage II sporulation protein M [Nanoarchaeota archaeon NZ13-N]RIB35474.1 MAG: hypothetical protein BXU00_01775 [Candidatus Nanoclepta minutus]
MYDLLLTNIKRKYLFLFLLTFFSIIFSSILVKNSGESSGILVITFSMIPLMEVINRLLEKEILKFSTDSRINIIIRHRELILSYFSIFFASIFACYISYIFFPNLFKQQIKAVYEIGQEAISYGYSFRKDAFFSFILINNLKVLMLFFTLSVIFGAGSIYLLLWNSSIIGTFLGMKAEGYSGSLIFKYVFYPLYSLLRILPHGILEFLGYFLASLSGGILAISLLSNRDKESLQQIVSDSLLLFLFSIFFIVIGAFVEAFL